MVIELNGELPTKFVEFCAFEIRPSRLRTLYCAKIFCFEAWFSIEFKRLSKNTHIKRRVVSDQRRSCYFRHQSRHQFRKFGGAFNVSRTNPMNRNVCWLKSHFRRSDIIMFDPVDLPLIDPCDA